MDIPARILKKMGFKADSQGVIDRFIQVNGSWEDHLQHTRNFILKAVTKKQITNLAVFGSGWCLDLPLDELTGMAGRIQLYDLVHPTQVLHSLRRYSNVDAIVADVTGGVVIRAYQSVKEFRKHGKKATPAEICHAIFRPAVIPDYIISLNLYSQLGELITEYLERHVPYTHDETDRIKSLLQQSHLQLLTPGSSCLITDFQEYNYNQDGTVSETTDVVRFPLPLSANTETWEWQFDPEGGYKPGKKTVLKVVAIEL